MVQHKGVKVTIVRHHDRQPYDEYKPNKKTSPGHRKAKTTYIESRSGERFAVVVEILPGFNFKSSRHLQITAAVDECVESNWTIDAENVNGSTAATSLEDRQVVWDSGERLINGKWKSYGLTFAPLKIGMYSWNIPASSCYSTDSAQTTALSWPRKRSYTTGNLMDV